MAIGAQPPEHALRTPAFVGRQAELDRLVRLLARVAGGTPVTLLVRGEVGVGKSRLLHELAGRARDSGARVLRGGCVPMGAGELPYAPLIEALRRLVRSMGREQVEELAGSGYAELASLVDGAGPGPDGWAAPAAARGAQSRVFGAVLAMLDRLGGDRPVVLVLEDLHWADPSTLDLFGYLARTRTDERLLLVGSYRTTALEPRHPLRTLVAELDLARLVQQLEVPRLSRGEVRQLLRDAFAGEVTHDLVERAFHLTDGNALLVEEVLASGMLTAPGRDDGLVAVPATVSDLVLPRFELLSPDARTVLEVAATAGRLVSHRLLAAVCELPDTRMLAALRECVDSQLLVANRLDDTYAFRHALVREAVHQRLIPGYRLRLHGSIAVALSADSGLSYAGQLTVAAELSYHWYEAYEFARALPSAVQAGNDAMRLLAFREAGQQFDRALAIWPRLPAAPEVAGTPKHRLLGLAADAARWAGRIDRAVTLARAAASEVDQVRQPAAAGEAYERLGSYLWESGDHGGAEQAYATAWALLADAPPSAAAARVLAVRATAEVRQGRSADGLRLGRDALSMARSVGARAEEGRALNTVGTALALQGEVAEGVTTLEEAIRIADAGGQWEDLFRAYGNLVFALENAGELERAVAAAVRGLDRARDAGLEHTRGRGVLANNLCAALVHLGRWDEAAGIIEQLLRDQPVAERLFPRLTMAEIAVARGRFDEAERLLAEVGQAGGPVRQPQFVGSRYACAAELAIWRQRPEAARAVVAEGLRAVAGADSLVVPLRLCALGLRNEADEWLRRDARPGPGRPGRDVVESAMAGYAAEVDRLAGGADQPPLPEVAVLRRMCEAEQSRTGPTTPPALWGEVATGWAGLQRRYLVAYARWREAQAAARDVMASRKVAARQDRRAHSRAAEQARDAAREAYRLATELGAQPLRQEIERLAAAARVDLAAGAPDRGTAPARAVDPNGLTPREQEVLPLLCDGWTNRKIAKHLYISEKTASAHVSSILQKLEVRRRGEAAAKAIRLGLVEPPPAAAR